MNLDNSAVYNVADYGSIQTDGEHDDIEVTVVASSNHDDVEQQQPHRVIHAQQSQVLSFEVTEDEGEEDGEEKETKPSGKEDSPALTRREMLNLLFCVLAWACTIANVTLVVGTSNVVILSIGGDSSLSSVPLATFFLGAALVSLTVTPWHFRRFGRKLGFLVGVGFGLAGTALGCLAVAVASPGLLISATTAFGAAMGIGFYMRFAAVEVVPRHWADKAVTLVVSGGCIAAFAGPESAEGTRGIFGEEYLYIGVFVMTGVFNVANAVFLSLVQFPDNRQQDQSTATKEPSTTEELSFGASLRDEAEHSSGHEVNAQHQHQHWSAVVSILQSRNFIIPVLLSALSWIIMALPMSVLRVAMHQLGYTSRQSLLTIELHFLGMYGPGFFTGQCITRCGPRLIAMVAVSVFLIAIVILQFAVESSNTNTNSGGYDGRDWNLTVWIVGMIAIGVGWNCAFSASTVGSTRSYTSRPDCKSSIQAANDGLTFLLAGAVISCASFIYHAGGEGLEGWRFVNWCGLGFIGIMAIILGVDVGADRQNKDVSASSVDVWSSPYIR